MEAHPVFPRPHSQTFFCLQNMTQLVVLLLHCSGGAKLGQKQMRLRPKYATYWAKSSRT